MSSTLESDDLRAFRDEWRTELYDKHSSIERREILSVDRGEKITSSSCYDASSPIKETPYPFQFTDSLLRSWQTVPNQTDEANNCSHVRKCTSKDDKVKPFKRPRRSLVDIFLDDLNDLNEIPFFDTSLPREIALRIFTFLDFKDLCSCAQVSRVWKTLADDNVLWHSIYHDVKQNDFRKDDGNMEWKDVVREYFVSARTLRMNWKEHRCHVSYYHHARGGILTSAHSHDDLLIAGYTNGQVKVWNILSDEDQTFESLDKSLVLIDEDNESLVGSTRNSVTCVRIGSQSKVMAGYSHGQIQLWDLSSDESVWTFEYPSFSVKDLLFSSDSRIGYAGLMHLSNGSYLLKIIDLNNQNDLDTLTIRDQNAGWTLPPVICAPLSTSPADMHGLLFLRRDSLSIHSCPVDTSSYVSKISTVESFYGTHFTCLRTSRRLVCLGLVSQIGIQAEYKVRCYDPISMSHRDDLRGHTSHVTCIDSSFVEGFTVVTGCHDRRVRLYDTRIPTTPIKTYVGHAGSVQCVQADDWKVISGDTEGYVCVWDQRKDAKLWESQSRHPVKYLKFTQDFLVTANIPVSNNMEVNDSDHMTHIRYRGRLQVGDFSVNHKTAAVPSICTSTYDVPEASNYNLSLITPYDSI